MKFVTWMVVILISIPQLGVHAAMGATLISSVVPIENGQFEVTFKGQGEPVAGDHIRAKRSVNYLRKKSNDEETHIVWIKLNQNKTSYRIFFGGKEPTNKDLLRACQFVSSELGCEPSEVRCHPVMVNGSILKTTVDFDASGKKEA